MSALAYRQYDPAQVGPDGYPPIWHEVKHQVREAAGYRCVRCLHPYKSGEHGSGEWTPCDWRCRHAGPCEGKPFSEVESAPWHPIAFSEQWPTVAEWITRMPVRAAWRILTVHHLDGDKCNLRWWNLAALCQRCHLEIQGRVRMDRVWPYEHSAWFRPYVAGYYAHRYLGEEIGREQAEERMDELLALEVRQLSLGGAA